MLTQQTKFKPINLAGSANIIPSIAIATRSIPLISHYNGKHCLSSKDLKRLLETFLKMEIIMTQSLSHFPTTLFLSFQSLF